MTEAEWLACRAPEEMLNFLRGQLSARKRRLFLCACCRRLLDGPEDEANRRALAVSEAYADGEAATPDLYAEADRSAVSADVKAALFGHERAADDARMKAFMNVYLKAMGGARTGFTGFAAATAARDREAEAQGELLREVVGNPFRLVFLDAAWLDWGNGTVPALARMIYEERAFERLPILADALEDAGCTDADILGHCRGPDPHVRGCWVVDLILGKE
jgi:hypothetical protein